MSRAMLRDLEQIGELRVVTTWDRRFAEFAPQVDRLHLVSHPEEEHQLFEKLSAESDFAFVLAPEFDSLLLDRTKLAKSLGTRLLSCSPEFIELAADKHRLYCHLTNRGVPSIPTWSLETWPPANVLEIFFQQGDCLVKPRNGAGSLDIHPMRNAHEFEQARDTLITQPYGNWILQPYIESKAYSVAVLSDGRNPTILPLAIQEIEATSCRYLGGRLPANIAHGTAFREIIERTIASLPATNGYWGIDLIQPLDKPDQPLIVEVNPRLTTSYLGYRALANENLARRLLPTNNNFDPISWQPATVHFTPETLDVVH